MFSKVHLPPQQQQQQQHPFQLSRECQTSEDDGSANSGGPTPVTVQKKPVSGGGGDGATIEVVRRPRGRPPGSKNKPKPPLVITREPEPVMSPHILEVSGGSDVVEALARFSHRKNTGLCILTGSGTVTNVTLRQPGAAPGATVTFHGRLEILSISATFLQPGISPAVPNCLSISLAAPQGQIVGGLVAGKLLAVGTVFILAATFNNPSYHRLPLEEEVRNNSVSGGGDVQSPPVSGTSPPVSGGGAESGHVQSVSGMYGCHLAPDVIWNPTARPF